ncbi:1836_t:CDS:2 [Ambispora gerdemannii]|uniref:1836_t:CDS:1 n=1 Tax=Ambispora gerdemannii TaxID=144530 RepID=A0A9N9BKY2_9GLOM|nr:1836_t:CDS:2 [Ambispora gerdemannii]
MKRIADYYFPLVLVPNSGNNNNTTTTNNNNLAFTSKSVFEFTILNPSKLSKPLYTPPFATANHMFWQLRFDPKFIEGNDEYCSVFLGAIPSPQEADNTTAAWAKRSLLSARLFLKNPISHVEIDKYSMTMNNYSAKEHTWGRRKFCKKSALSHDSVILGVEFDKAEIGLSRHTATLPGEIIPKDLLEAWQSQLTEPQIADVEFNVDGHTIYANSAILAKRSEYFQRMFGGKWSESTATSSLSKINDSQTSETPSSSTIVHFGQESARIMAIAAHDVDDPIIINHDSKKPHHHTHHHHHHIIQQQQQQQQPLKAGADLLLEKVNHHRFKIEVTDFHHVTFLEMLKFLYTNKVTFNNANDSHTSSLEMFRVADKYLIEDLRQRAKTRIFDELSISNAAETLFGTDWTYPELKDYILKFLVKHFREVKQTEGFKNITSNSAMYPTFPETITEILELLEPNPNVVNLDL